MVYKRFEDYNLMWSVLKALDQLCGVYMMSKDSTQLPLWRRVCRVLNFVSFFGFMALLLYNAYTQRKDLIILILSLSGFVIFATSTSVNIKYFEMQENFVKVLEWCRKVFDGKHPRVVKARKLCAKVVLINIGLCYFLGTTCTILPAIIGIFLPEDVVPKYTPPMPFHLPVLDSQTWIAFWLNTLLQSAGVSMYDTLDGILFSIFAMHYIALVPYCDKIIDKVEEFGEIILAESIKNDERIPQKLSKPAWSNASSSQVLMTEANNDFDEKIKEIVEMYNEVIE